MKNLMSKREIVEVGVKTVVGASAAHVITNVVSATTPLPLSPLNRVIVLIGGYCIGMYVGDKVADYTFDQAVQLYDTIDEAIKEIKAAVKEARQVQEGAAQ